MIRFIPRFALFALLAVPLMTAPGAGAWADDFFIPGQPKGAAAPAKPAAPKSVRPAIPPPVQLPSQGTAVGGGAPDDPGTTPMAVTDMALPPQPDLPPMAKGASPPAAVIGVMGVPEVMRASSAARQVEKMIGERRDKLSRDAQKEQATWRDMQQALVNDRAKLTQDQGRARERDLQERITSSQRQVRDRGRIIQEAAQYALAQIERTLVAVIRQVAEARGMNLVLHRAQVALNVNDFDITEQVVDQMNKVLPSVVIPPDGVSPPKLAAAPADATAATPAAAAPAGTTAPPAVAAPAAPAK